VDPKKLKIKQKLTIPASTKSADATSAAPAGTPDASGGETYTVKSGDTLTKVAKKHGVSLKALKAANNLTTDHIKVGEKLVIPAKAEAAAPAPATDNTAVPAVPPPASMPAPATPAPAATPGH
jgi:LysM repeat protein